MIDHDVVPWLGMSSVCSVEKLLEPHHPPGLGECWHLPGADGRPGQSGGIKTSEDLAIEVRLLA